MAVACPLLASPAVANPAGDQVVINEVYGGGGNSGSTYKADFVELYNPTNAAVDLTGWTVQYRSATGPDDHQKNTLERCHRRPRSLPGAGVDGNRRDQVAAPHP